MSIEITSPSFNNEESIPTKYSGQGEDVSPPLKFSGIPKDAKSIALISDDPDAPMGTWVHWVIYNLPPDTTELPEAVPASKTLENGAIQGKNNFGEIGYGGPNPPPGPAHRYFFKAYALDTKLPDKPGMTKDEVLQEMKGHVLAEGQLMGTYQK